MSDDLISKQVAIDDAHRQIWYRMNPNMRERIDTWLVNLPTVQPEQKTGRWEFIGEEIGAFNIRYQINKCSECGWTNSLFIPKNFCPNCGAKMESDNHDN